MYQLTRLQKTNNVLPQDDRIDALQMSCFYWLNMLTKDDEMSMKQRQEDLLDAELDLYWGVTREHSWIKLY